MPHGSIVRLEPRVRHFDDNGNEFQVHEDNWAILGEQLKTGHTCTLQNRPMESGRDYSGFYAFGILLST